MAITECILNVFVPLSNFKFKYYAFSKDLFYPQSIELCFRKGTFRLRFQKWIRRNKFSLKFREKFYEYVVLKM